MYTHDEIHMELEKPSKTQLKKIANEATKFAQSLAKLSPNQLSVIGIPLDIKEEIITAQKMKASGARNRHLKVVSNMIRGDEVWGSVEAAKQYGRVSQGKQGLIFPRQITKPAHDSASTTEV